MTIRSIKLPMVYPPITSFHHHASLFSIILNNPSAVQWIYNTYVQLEILKPEFRKNPLEGSDVLALDFTIDRINVWSHCPFTTHQYMDRRLINDDSIVELLIQRLAQGYYVLFYVDCFYLSNNRRFKNMHYGHVTFLYGYDLGKKLFYIADFAKPADRYEYGEVSFAQIQMAYSKAKVPTGKHYKYKSLRERFIGFSRLLPNVDYKFDVTLLYDYLHDYLNSVNSRKKHNILEDYPRDVYCQFGLSVYEDIEYYIEQQIDQLLKGERLWADHRELFALADHKQLMMLRLQYLMDAGYLKNTGALVAGFLEIQQLAKKALLFSVKYNLVKNVKLLAKTLPVIKEIRNKEDIAITNLLEKLGPST